MKVLFLTIGSQTTPSTRFRVKQYFSRLEEEKIRFRHLPIPHATHKRLALLRHIQWADIVFLQKKLFSLVELTILQWFGRPIIFDMDDVIFHEHPKNVGTRSADKKIARNRRRYQATIQAAQYTIAGNAALADDVTARGGRVSILPTPLDTDRFKPAVSPPDGKGPIVVGWIGIGSNLYYLDMLAKPLQRLSQRFPHMVLRLISNGEKSIPGVPVENRPWSEGREVLDLQSFHIGIMPLTDDIYSRGKCGFKLLQYMSVGLPSVSSRVGMNKTIVDQGQDGFLAEGDQEWETRLAELIHSASLRRSMGAAAREKVVARYSLEALFPEWLNIIRTSHACGSNASGKGP